MGVTHRLPKLPEGYRLDLASDPDAPTLRRPDGTIVARFGARGMTYEAVEREALAAGEGVYSRQEVFEDRCSSSLQTQGVPCPARRIVQLGPLGIKRFVHQVVATPCRRITLRSVFVLGRLRLVRTLLLSKVIHPKFVQELLGHATVAITLDTYSHVMPGMEDHAARAIEETFEENVEELT